MTEATRRERLRAETEREIRQAARALLVERGRDAVTLRAIARQLGITAPALYRYYDSHEALLRQLCDDICADMAAELHTDLAAEPTGQVKCQVRTVCHGFRRWALAHPEEFALVFASPRDALGADRFGSVFLQLAGRLIASNLAVEHGGDVPEALHEDLARFQQVLTAAVEEHGTRVGDELNLGAIFHVVQSWVRLYGHVALEVFGRFPFVVSNPEPMFDSMIDQMLSDIGLEEEG